MQLNTVQSELEAANAARSREEDEVARLHKELHRTRAYEDGHQYRMSLYYLLSIGTSVKQDVNITLAFEL
jgi:hypothetical protein